MFKRCISAFVGIAVFLSAVLLCNSADFSFLLDLLMSVAAALATFEIFRATGIIKNKVITITGIVYSFIFVFENVLIRFLETLFDKPVLINSFYLPFSLFAYLFPILILLVMLFSDYKLKFEEIAVSFFAPYILSHGFNSFLSIRDSFGNNPEKVYYILILTACGAWIADTGAFFVGSAIGKHKLCPKISPKKSVEGFIGGLLFNIIVFPALCLLFKTITPSLTPNYPVMALLGAVCALCGCAGDLIASYIKRSVGIKDYGKIMPGHGGILDRFDSFLLVSPVICLFIDIFNYYDIIIL